MAVASRNSEAGAGGEAGSAVVALPPQQRRPDVSAFACQLLSFEVVRYFDERGAYGKLEQLGFQVGAKLVERLAWDHSRFSSTLEVVKFLCKEVWGAMFGKQVDKLQTNHRGVFVLHDNNFTWTASMEVDHHSDESLDEVKKFLVVPCGLIRGVLTNLGLRCTVRAEFATLPACLFNVQVQQELLTVNA